MGVRRDKVGIDRVSKRGEWYTVRGHVEGRPTECHIPAASVDTLKPNAAEGLMKRSLAGTAMQERGE